MRDKCAAANVKFFNQKLYISPDKGNFAVARYKFLYLFAVSGTLKSSPPEGDKPNGSLNALSAAAEWVQDNTELNN